VKKEFCKSNCEKSPPQTNKPGMKNETAKKVYCFEENGKRE
jgi:hypothetical protein